MLLTGCGASSGSGPTPAQLVAATSAKTSAGNARLALTGSVASGAQSFPIHGSGAFDFAQHRGLVDLSGPQSGTITDRIIGGVTYEKLPAQLAARLGGKQWLKIDPAALAASGGGAQLGSLSQSVNPTQVLTYLRGATGTPVTVGTDDVRGARATHYRTQVDVAQVVQHGALSPAAGDAFRRQFGTGTFPVEVWIDAQGRAVRTSYALRPVSGVGSFTFTQELYDFGHADVGGVVAPPASQTQDAGALLAGTARG